MAHAVSLSSVAARVSAKSSALRGKTLRVPSAARPARRVAMSARAEITPLGDDDKKGLVDSVETFIFDCDGVIWKGDPHRGRPRDHRHVARHGQRLIFVTNNSTSRAPATSRSSGLGLEITAEEVFSSSFAAAAYLDSKNFPKDKKVYVIGETGILEELDGVGIKHLGGEGRGNVTLASGQLMEHDEDVAAVVVGFDRNVNHYKIQYATLCIRENPGCEFIATNMDAVTHLTDAQEWAGNGSMVRAIKGSAPSPPSWASPRFMLDYIANKFNIRKDQICMVGDRLDTDILFREGRRAQDAAGALGRDHRGELKSPENTIHPTLHLQARGPRSR